MLNLWFIYALFVTNALKTCLWIINSSTSILFLVQHLQTYINTHCEHIKTVTSKQLHLSCNINLTNDCFQSSKIHDCNYGFIIGSGKSLYSGSRSSWWDQDSPRWREVCRNYLSRQHGSLHGLYGSVHIWLQKLHNM